MERIEKLKLLNQLLNSEEFHQLVALEKYFFGDTISGGCTCKLNSVKSRLSQFWESTGKQELINGTK